MKKITYSCLIKMRCNALWAAEYWFAEAHFGTVGAAGESVRYARILKRIDDAMWSYKSTNEFREVGV